MEVKMKKFPGMVLTGVGLVSAAGAEKSDLFSYVRETSLPEDKAGHGAELEPGQLLKVLNITEPKLKIARYMDPVSKNAVVALGAAVTDAGMEPSQIADAPYDYGIVFGTTRGACATREALYESLVSREGKTLSGTIFSHCGYNIAAAMAAVAFGIKGPNLTIAGRADLGIAVLNRARQLMVSQRAHTVFAGFTECDGLLRRRNGPRGEWAYVLALERKDRATERGAVVLAEVSVEPAHRAYARGERGIVCGLNSRTAPVDRSAKTLALPLPGMKTIGNRYASLIMLGLLSHDQSLKERFPAVTFTTSAGKNPTEVRVIYGGEEKKRHDL
jgi:hypothetical protein